MATISESIRCESLQYGACLREDAGLGEQVGAEGIGRVGQCLSDHPDTAARIKAMKARCAKDGFSRPKGK